MASSLPSFAMMLLVTLMPLAMHVSAALPCAHPIYCSGPILEAVQMMGIFPDSKTFVDMPLNANISTVLEAAAATNFSDVTATKAFVAAYFGDAGSDLDTWTPTDWTPTPPVAADIKDADLKQWAIGLNERWQTLGKKMKADAQAAPDQHSLIFVPNPFIVPGGRFREFYYWDTYWITRGLLHCGMFATVKGMLQNYASLIDRFGFVPNGGRVYYERRSQPPVLTLMLADYYEFTNDSSLVKDMLPLLVKEYSFWMTNRSVNVTVGNNVYTVNIYNVDVASPRPESFKEDFAAAQGMNHTEQEKLWAEIASGAETGWDFSSRWMDDKANLSTRSLHTSIVVPVDLNSILYKVETQLADLFHRMDMAANSTLFGLRAVARLEAISKIFWDPQRQLWFDFNLTSQARQQDVYAAVFVPAWAGVTDSWSDADRTSLFNSMQTLEAGPAATSSKNNVKWLDMFSGVPTSSIRSGQQWDYPNMWPPLLSFAVAGLQRLRLDGADMAAFALAQKYISSAYVGWTSNPAQYMFEKYSVESNGQSGGGGEYTPQNGFGWSNGVALDLLHVFGQWLSAPQAHGRYDDTTNKRVIIASVVSGGFALGAGLLLFMHYRGRKSERRGYNPINEGANL
eukprot:m.101306 g.101306  ORF g.101306 m.101306 type:complete len:625 (-) comp15655_c0_seq1:81-1955(-)